MIASELSVPFAFGWIGIAMSLWTVAESACCSFPLGSVIKMPNKVPDLRPVHEAAIVSIEIGDAARAATPAQ